MTIRVAVLSGGGAHGAFQVGALNVTTSIEYDAFFGISTGALSAAILAQNTSQIDALTHLRSIYLNIDGNKSIYNSPPLGYLGKAYRLLFKDSIYDPKGLKALINAQLHPKGFVTTFGCGVTEVEDGSYAAIQVSPDINDPNILDLILASASYPVFFPPVLIAGKHYIDGGVRRQTPLKDAVNWLASKSSKPQLDGSSEQKELHIFLTTPLNAGTFKYTKPSALTLMFRSISLLSTSIYIDDIGQLLSYNAIPSKAFIIVYLYVPTIDYGDSLNFDPKNISKMISDGQQCKPIILKNTADLDSYVGGLE